MAWIIEPSTDIYLLKDVHIDSNYEHTLYFPRSGSSIAQLKALQAEYFLTTWGKTQNGYFPSNTYQREDLGVIRLNVPRDSIYDANYLMFKNSYFGDKWFYAFIDRVEYVNNNCCRIHYTIDLIQTWYYDFTISRCFVEREHTATDDIGDNLINENFDVGKYIFNPLWGLPDIYPQNYFPTQFTEMFIVVGATYYRKEEIDPQNPQQTIVSYPDYNGGIGGGTTTGVNYAAFRYPSEFNLFKEFIAGAGGMASKIVSIYLYPIALKPIVNDDVPPNPNLNLPAHFDFACAKPTKGDSLNGYVPKNGKLYTYPYNGLLVTNEEGEAKTYEFEKFGGNNAYFRIYGSHLNDPTIQCVPLAYLSQTENFLESFADNKFTLCGWNYNVYEQWFAENRNGLAIKTIASAINLGIGAGSNALGVADLAGKQNDFSFLLSAAITGANIQAKGNEILTKNSGTIVQGLGRKGFHFYPICMRSEQLKIIDNYFSLYGYAIKEIKIPNVFDPQGTPRPYWNYLKTNGCIIHGANNSCVPADVEKALCTIFDKGITFWNYLYDIGSYELDNSPT